MTDAVAAPSIAETARQRLERWLERNHARVPLWLPVALAAGIGAWFALPTQPLWIATIAAALGSALAGTLLRGRAGAMLLWGGLAVACGCALVWARAGALDHQVLDRATVTAITGRVVSVTPMPARQRTRIVVIPDDPALPRRVRVTVADRDRGNVALEPGAQIEGRVRLTPPPGPIVPGAYDFARAAWFQRIGAVGNMIGPITRTDRADTASTLRARLSAHIRAQVPGSAGGIAAAFASGDRGGIAKADDDAMRAAGLTHLLSISGLHVTAVVGFVMWLTMRIAALSRRIALRWSVPVIGAVAGAGAGVGYTLLTGAEVPTVRSCVAAVLVVAALALGRQAMTLRLVAGGALFVLLLWPESLVGASFQFSFTAIAAIVALHESALGRRLFLRREEPWWRRIARGATGLFATGMAVELALTPIALYHFHREGLYGALANVAAIPFTTFVIMPLEALALAGDALGVGAPFWAATAAALDALLWLAHRVAAWPGAQAAVADVPMGAFLLAMGGLLWLMLWEGRVRAAGLLPIAAAGLIGWAAPSPDLIVTRDGSNVALRTDAGWAILRPRAGDFVREALGNRGGTMRSLADLDTAPGADCSRDACAVTLTRGQRQWRVLAIRSAYRLEWRELTDACAAADIVIAERKLPDGCRPQWLRADRRILEKTGGLAISLFPPTIIRAAPPRDDHPWATTKRD